MLPLRAFILFWLGLLLALPAVAAAPASLALSLFEPTPGGLAWRRHDPLTAKQLPAIATFPGSADHIRVAWSHGRDQALVWFEHESGPDRLWQVTLPHGAKQPLPAPPVGQWLDVGYAPDGGILALTLQNEHTPQPLKPQQDKQGWYFRLEGERYSVPAGQEGIPALAHAFRWERGAWRKVETALTTDGWDYAQRTDALKAASTFGPRTHALLTPHPEGREVPDGPLRRQLFALEQGLDPEGGQWLGVGKTSNTVYVWQEQGEFVYATRLIAWMDGRRPVKAPGPAWRTKREAHWDIRFAALMPRGRHLLVSDAWSGERPWLYDVATRQVVYRSPTARAAVFWP